VASSSSRLGSDNADGWTLRPALLFLSVSTPVGVFPPSAPQLNRYTALKSAYQIMSFEEEIREIPQLENVGLALFEFAESVFPQNSFNQDNHGRWVARPENFVTLRVQPQAENIAITLRGNPGEFLEFGELHLRQDQEGYSIFRISEASELRAASVHISRAAELYRRGRNRTPQQPVLTEERI